jgi:hypothetical protein
MAVDLLRSPSNVKRVRTVSLPPDVSSLLLIAAGDEEAIRKASEATGRSPRTMREAAGFYIEQVLLHPDADSYRVLGARPDASTEQLRRNMALLIRWLHPDTQNGAERTIFTSRVTQAWNDLKSEEKRAAYDRSRRKTSLSTNKNAAQHRPSGSRSHHNGRMPPRRGVGHHAQQGGMLKRVLLMLFGKNLL